MSPPWATRAQPCWGSSEKLQGTHLRTVPPETGEAGRLSWVGSLLAEGCSKSISSFPPKDKAGSPAAGKNTCRQSSRQSRHGVQPFSAGWGNCPPSRQATQKQVEGAQAKQQLHWISRIRVMSLNMPRCYLTTHLRQWHGSQSDQGAFAFTCPLPWAPTMSSSHQLTCLLQRALLQPHQTASLQRLIQLRVPATHSIHVTVHDANQPWASAWDPFYMKMDVYCDVSES